MKTKPSNAAPAFEWPRSNPDDLAKFDPETQRCTMNCGQSALDPRSKKECIFQCDDCEVIPQNTPGSREAR